jgi:hypothetical protein
MFLLGVVRCSDVSYGPTDVIFKATELLSVDTVYILCIPHFITSIPQIKAAFFEDLLTYIISRPLMMLLYSVLSHTLSQLSHLFIDCTKTRWPALWLPVNNNL